jgi:hypothetical protein
MSKYFLCLLVLISINLSGQEIVSEFRSPRGQLSKKTDLIVYSKFEDKSNKIFLTITDQRVTSFLLDSSFSFSPNKVSFIPSKLVGLDPLGGYYSNEWVTLLYSKKNKKEFTAFKLNVTDNSVSYSSFKLPKGELFLESFSTGTAYFFVTVKWNSSTLTFYRTNESGEFIENKVDLSRYTFGIKTKPSLFENLRDLSGDVKFSMITYESISGLSQTYIKNKGYYDKGKFYLTLDKDYGKTILVKVNIENWETSFAKFGESTESCSKSSSGSFLYYDNIFISQVCEEHLGISVYDINSGLLVKNYSVQADEEISFRNTPIIQEGGNFFSGDKRELGQTKALVRKILRSKMAIAVNALNSRSALEVTVGSFVEFQRGGMPGASFVPGGTAPSTFGSGSVALPTTYNPTYTSYQSYKVTKSASFKSLLNSTSLDHIKGKIDKNDFDKMEDYFEEDGSTIPNLGIKSSDVLTKTIFYHKGEYYAVFYCKSKESFVIMKP